MGTILYTTKQKSKKSHTRPPQNTKAITPAPTTVITTVLITAITNVLTNVNTMI
jgi:hypothetical protein